MPGLRRRPPPRLGWPPRLRPPLAARDATAVEEMDRADADPATLRRTYAAFWPVNWCFSRPGQLYAEFVRPHLAHGRTGTVLDVGSGGGDIAAYLARRADRDGYSLRVTGVDPNPAAHAFAAATHPDVEFRRATSTDLVAEGARFDVVLSNHVLHHLTPAEFEALLRDSEELAVHAAVHADLRRSAVAYALFAVAALPFAVRTFIRRDGLTSLRRSYSPSELRAVARAGWSVETRAPFRNLLVFRGAGNARGTGVVRRSVAGD